MRELQKGFTDCNEYKAMNFRTLYFLDTQTCFQVRRSEVLVHVLAFLKVEGN
jgi:hypothetical protein